MRRWTLGVVILLAGCGLSEANPLTETRGSLTAGQHRTYADQPGFFPYPIHTETLDNGLKVIIVPMESAGLVAYWTIVRTGSRDEVEPGHTGFAHFFEHMMFRGTARFPQDVYNEILTKLGADANAFTSDDLTAYHLSILPEDLEIVMDLESDRFQNLRYTEQAFRTEAGAVYGEYRKSRSNPFFTLYEAVRAAAFKVHTYRHTTMGFVEDIQRMPEMFDYSLSFLHRYYRPDNSVLLITVVADDREVAGYPLRIDAGDVQTIPVERIFEH